MSQRKSSPDVAALRDRFADGDASIGIVGLGYVGMPLAVACCRAGYRVIGFDTDPDKVSQITAGYSPVRTIEATTVAALRAAGQLSATGDFRRLTEPDAILICVPTPLGRHREPDLTFVENTGRAIAANLRPGQLVVLESTTYPGTTRDVLRPILESSGLRSGIDFFLAYSAEREDPGNREYDTARIPKVVAGDGAEALTLALALYGRVVARTVPVSSLETAEAVKITENVFRAVNIALVNELKMLFQAMDIDIFEVIAAAKTKPFGFMPFYPGPGLGGHCIPIDPFYLTWKAREVGIATRFIELAGEINSAMPGYVIGRLREELDRRFGKGLNGAQVLVMGVAYKKNVEDTRESPALAIIERLESQGATVSFHDPLVPLIPSIRDHPRLAGRRSIPLDPDTVASFDAVLIITDHDGIDWELIARHARLVVDTRNRLPAASTVAAA